MPYAVEIFQITKEFPLQKRFRDFLFSPFSKEKVIALKNISLKAHRGEIFCLLGPNGAGKTSLVKVLCTLILPTEGKASVNGYDVVKNPKEVRRAIGYVISDERSFYWRLNAYQNLKFFGILNNIPGSELNQRIKKVLELVNLEKKAHVLFKDFSLGMKQKLAIARAFLPDPEILFMDEPTRSLDPTSAHLLRHFILHELVERQKKTVFLATHNLKEVEEIGHRMAILHEGTSKACGSVGELCRDIKGVNCYSMVVKKMPSDFQGKLRHLLKGNADIKVQSDKGYGLELEIMLRSQNGIEISDVIAYLVNIGGKIESCSKKEATLYEIYSKYTGDNLGKLRE